MAGGIQLLESGPMLESVFFLFLTTALVVVVFSFWRRDPMFLVLGSVLLFASGMLVLDTQSTGGIEETNGLNVVSLGNNDFAIDYNTSFRNAGNDVSLNVLGNVLAWGSVVGFIMALGFLIQSRRGND